MFDNHLLSIVIPAYNEEQLIYQTVSKVPEFIDFIIIVNDASTDSTQMIIKSFVDNRIISINHETNLGVGKAIISGYKEALNLGASIIIVIGADNQMDQNDMTHLIHPIINNQADYVKGNRFLDEGFFQSMPKMRIVGNIFSSLLTCLGSGYYNIFDTQCGYTAIKKETLARLDMDKIYGGYGFPSDFLFKLSNIKARVQDVRVKCIYGNEKSGIKPIKYIFTIFLLFLKNLIFRKNNAKFVLY